MKRHLFKIIFLLITGVTTGGCKTYNVFIHNGPERDRPLSWDLDEPVMLNFTGMKNPVNFKTVCGKKGWKTAQIYQEFFVGWKIAVKCQS